LLFDCLKRDTPPPDDNIECRAVRDDDARKDDVDYVLLRRKWTSVLATESDAFDNCFQLSLIGQARKLLDEIRDAKGGHLQNATPKNVAPELVKATDDDLPQDWFLFFAHSDILRMTCGMRPGGRSYAFARIGGLSKTNVDAAVDALGGMFTNADEEDANGMLFEYPPYEFQAILVAKLQQDDRGKFLLALSDLQEWKDNGELQPALRKLLDALTPCPDDTHPRSRPPSNPP
jgi:hypothetical protein